MFYVLKFSKENCFTPPFYCTVLCAGRSTKEGLNHLLHTAFLGKNQETFQILLFSPILLNLVKIVSYFLFIALPCEKTVLYFYFTALCYVQGVRKKLEIASFIEHA